MRLNVFAVMLVVGGVVSDTPLLSRPRIEQEKPRLERLRWLTGCWERGTARAMTQEQWMRPAGGTMLGMSRSVRTTGARDSTTEYEFLRVFQRGDKLVYAALPSGQRYAEFVESEITDTSIVFANATHDFPQFIRYARHGADSMVARIDGTIQGRARAVDFRYARANCA